ncbi:MAG: hypothetical protein SP1CHLAM54_17540 [Chlamydiia bacterium]|nr:hypothetical protein [Chlamydiia bacterium]MCH9616642.1 hypothetical protein [Chlamydiia bacterium]
MSFGLAPARAGAGAAAQRAPKLTKLPTKNTDYQSKMSSIRYGLAPARAGAGAAAQRARKKDKLASKNTPP